MLTDANYKNRGNLISGFATEQDVLNMVASSRVESCKLRVAFFPFLFRFRFQEQF